MAVKRYQFKFLEGHVNTTSTKRQNCTRSQSNIEHILPRKQLSADWIGELNCNHDLFRESIACEPVSTWECRNSSNAPHFHSIMPFSVIHLEENACSRATKKVMIYHFAKINCQWIYAVLISKQAPLNLYIVAYQSYIWEYVRKYPKPEAQNNYQLYIKLNTHNTILVMYDTRRT